MHELPSFSYRIESSSLTTTHLASAQLPMDEQDMIVQGDALQL